MATAVIYVNANGPIEFVLNLIQNNVVGPPVIHQRTEWNFDPYVGALERREKFQRMHGFRGEGLIERLGVGVDGHHDARLAQQRARDEGLLGGTIFQFKSDLNTIDRV